MGFLDVTELDLSVNDKLLFNAKEIVEFGIKDVKELPQSGNLLVTAEVLSGEHAKKEYRLSLSKKSKFAYASFLNAFWSRQELLEKKATLNKIIGRKFSAVTKPVRQYNGKDIQDLDGFIDLGLVEQPKEEQQNLSF